MTHQFLPRHIGGTELYTLALARALRQRGDEVQVITCHESPSGDPKDFGPRSTEVEGIRVTEIHYNLSVAPRPARFEYENPHIEAWVDQCLESSRPDVVHFTHLMKLSGAALRPPARRRLPTIVTLTDFWTICGRHTLLRSNGALCTGPRHALDCVPCLRATHSFGRARLWPAQDVGNRVFARQALESGQLWPRDVLGDVWAIARRNPTLLRDLRKADRIICLTQFQRRFLVSNGVPASLLEVVPHGHDAPPSRASISPGDVRRFAFFGSIVPHKGVHILLDALRGAPDLAVSLDLYGAVDPAMPYAAHVLELSLQDPRVSWRGLLAEHELPSVLSTYGSLLMPAQWYENAPFIVQLALALGVRVIASRLGTLEELLLAHPGHMLVSAADPVAWSEAIRLASSGAMPIPQPVTGLPTWGGHQQRVFDIYAAVLGGKR